MYPRACRIGLFQERRAFHDSGAYYNARLATRYTGLKVAHGTTKITTVKPNESRSIGSEMPICIWLRRTRRTSCLMSHESLIDTNESSTESAKSLATRTSISLVLDREGDTRT